MFPLIFVLRLYNPAENSVGLNCDYLGSDNYQSWKGILFQSRVHPAQLAGAVEYADCISPQG